MMWLKLLEAYALASAIVSLLVIMAGCNIADQRAARARRAADPQERLSA